MKNIFAALFILMSFTLVAQQDQIIEMTPYDVTDDEQEIFEELGLPEKWACRFETCPEKFKANGINIFALSDSNDKSIKIRPSKRVVNKMRKNPKAYGFVEGGEMKVYKIGSGLVKTISGIRVLAGDK